MNHAIRKDGRSRTVPPIVVAASLHAMARVVEAVDAALAADLAKAPADYHFSDGVVTVCERRIETDVGMSSLRIQADGWRDLALDPADGGPLVSMRMRVAGDDAFASAAGEIRRARILLHRAVHQSRHRLRSHARALELVEDVLMARLVSSGVLEGRLEIVTPGTSTQAALRLRTDQAPEPQAIDDLEPWALATLRPLLSLVESDNVSITGITIDTHARGIDIAAHPFTSDPLAAMRTIAAHPELLS